MNDSPQLMIRTAAASYLQLPEVRSGICVPDGGHYPSPTMTLDRAWRKQGVSRHERRKMMREVMRHV